MCFSSQASYFSRFYEAGNKIIVTTAIVIISNLHKLMMLIKYGLTLHNKGTLIVVVGLGFFSGAGGVWRTLCHYVFMDCRIR